MKPLLLVPAPDSELMKIALLNGADGSYAPVKGMTNVRFKTNHFDKPALEKILDFAKNEKKLVYPVINGSPTEGQLPEYQDMIEFCRELSAPGIVLGDWGLIGYWGEKLAGSKTQVIASGMAGAINRSSVALLKGMGVKRVILPRLQSLQEITHIIQAVPEVEYEVFMNGSLCPLYEGRGCFLRNVFPGYKRGVCFIYPEEFREIRKNGEVFWGLGDLPLFREKPTKYLPPCQLSLDLCLAEKSSQVSAVWEPLLQSNLKFLEELIRFNVAAFKFIPFLPAAESYSSQVALWRRLIDAACDTPDFKLTRAVLKENDAEFTVNHELLIRVERR